MPWRVDLEYLVGEFVLDGELLGAILPNRRVDELVAFPDIEELLSKALDGFTKPRAGWESVRVRSLLADSFIALLRLPPGDWGRLHWLAYRVAGRSISCAKPKHHH